MTAGAAALEAMPVPAAASAAVRWYVLLAMCMVYTVSIADRYVISTVLEPIRLELRLTDSGVAFLTGVSLSLFYVSFGIPLSLLADRLNRRNLIALSLLAWSTMTILCGRAASYWQLLFPRIGVGIGEAGGTPAATSIIADYFPPLRRPMALTVFSLGAPIGAWVGAQIAGEIADAFGWRAVFLALGLPGVLLGAIVYFTVREPRRGQLDAVGTGTGPSLAETARFLWSQRSACHLMLGSAITALWGWGLTWWTPAFLMRSYGISAGQAGSITGPIHLYAGIGATVFTGWLLGRPCMHDPRRILWLLGGGIAFATIPSIIIFATHSLPLTKAMFWIFIPSIYFYIGPCYGVLNNLSPPRMRAQFCAATLLVANVGNLIIAPQLIGLLSDLFAPGHIANAASLRLALLCLAPTGFWSAFHLLWCTRTLQHDQARAIGNAGFSCKQLRTSIMETE
ncbi:MAG TPA: MFS transporter [Steroidobacteraceae bacterium]